MPKQFNENSSQTEMVHCPICTHNVPAQIEVAKKMVRVLPGQKCPRCRSTLDVAVVLRYREAA
jgi:transposase-like protein